MKKSKNKNLKKQIDYIADNSGLTILVSFFVFFVLTDIVLRIDNTFHVIGPNETAALMILIGILIIAIISGYFTYTKLAPWLNYHVSKKLDFPLSRLPLSIIGVFCIIVFFVITLLVVNTLRTTWGMTWLPDSGAIASLYSVCVAVIAYLGNSTDRYIITVKSKNGFLRDGDKLPNNKFLFWCTNIGGKTGNIKYLGWCFSTDREKISLEWNMNSKYLHRFVCSTHKLYKQNFSKLGPGEILNCGAVSITKEVPKDFYLVFSTSTGQIYFREVCWDKEWKKRKMRHKSNIRNKRQVKSNKMSKKSLVNKKQVYCVTFSFVSTLILSSIFNLGRFCDWAGNIKYRSRPFINWLSHNSWYLWVNKEYYTGLLLILIAICVTIFMWWGLHKIKFDLKNLKVHKLYIFNWLIVIIVFILLKDALNNILGVERLNFITIIFFWCISWLISVASSELIFRKKGK